MEQPRQVMNETGFFSATTKNAARTRTKGLTPNSVYINQVGRQGLRCVFIGDEYEYNLVE